MRTRFVATVTSLAALLLVSCGGASDTSAPAEAQSGTSTTDEAAAVTATSSPSTAAASQAPSPLQDEELYRALLALGIDHSYQLALEDGTVEIVQSMEGYGALRWTADTDPVTVTHRYVDDEWEWIYVDDNVGVDAVTESGLTDEELADYQSLADEVVAAVGEPGPAILRYAYKQEGGGASQADFTVTTTRGETSLHLSTDGEHRIGRIDLRWPAI